MICHFLGLPRSLRPALHSLVSLWFWWLLLLAGTLGAFLFSLLLRLFHKAQSILRVPRTCFSQTANKLRCLAHWLFCLEALLAPQYLLVYTERNKWFWLLWHHNEHPICRALPAEHCNETNALYISGNATDLP